MAHNRLAAAVAHNRLAAAAVAHSKQGAEPPSAAPSHRRRAHGAIHHVSMAGLLVQRRLRRPC